VFPQEVIDAAIEYVECIHRIESGRYQERELWELEDLRVQLHARFMDELDKAGIEYADRFDAHRKAIDIYNWLRR
jgi:hypothetical protein